MAMDTDRLIERLAGKAGPVQRLAVPWIRTAMWFAIAAPYIALVVVMMPPRGDLFAKLWDVRYLLEQAAALSTGIAAAVAAFTSIVPGYDRRISLLPLVPLSVWLASLAEGCIQTWMRADAGGISLTSDFVCIPAIALVGAVPALAMAVMLRKGAPLRPNISAALGGLAAAGLGNFGLRLFHHQDASLMVLVWQMGTVFMLTMLSGSAGRLFLNWRPLVANVRRSLGIG
jgi:hypothetical protein